ncbi:MAG: hypothetical protein GVY29_00935, partial [Spirochaetes bacterium]|nr:hypothetical protein [Spirochaetota bacterium]
PDTPDTPDTAARAPREAPAAPARVPGEAAAPDPGDRGAARLVPTGVMLCEREAVERIAESLTVRPLLLRRDLIPSSDSADLDPRRDGHCDYAYVGVPELVAAVGRWRGRGARILARGGRPPVFVRTRGEARQLPPYREAPAK